MVDNRVFDAVQQAVAEAMGMSADEIEPDARLFGDLGAESIDMLDICYRINRFLGTKIKAEDVDAYVQGGIPDDDFADNRNFITARGLQQLKAVMPQIDLEEQQGRLRAEEVANLLTVQNLAQMVSLRVEAGAA